MVWTLQTGSCVWKILIITIVSQWHIPFLFILCIPSILNTTKCKSSNPVSIVSELQQINIKFPLPVIKQLGVRYHPRLLWHKWAGLYSHHSKWCYTTVCALLHNISEEINWESREIVRGKRRGSSRNREKRSQNNLSNRAMRRLQVQKPNRQ